MCRRAIKEMRPALRYSGQASVSHELQNLLLATALLASTPACFAERADRDKPMLLEADQVLVDDTHQASTFTGNVRLIQGTMMIRGDRIEVVKHKSGFNHANAYGKTASFRQKREGTEEYVEGYGERIEYDTGTGTVDFYVQARVKREQDEVRGDHITYSMKTEIFQASSSPDSMDTKPGRVRAVLQPKPKPDAPASPKPLPITPGKTLTPTE
jgi:lipopolysaccharide export system protein LptA